MLPTVGLICFLFGTSFIVLARPEAQMALANRYYACRHAESTANVSGIIVSDPVHGVRQEYGLSPRGREQAVEVRAMMSSFA